MRTEDLTKSKYVHNDTLRRKLGFKPPEEHLVLQLVLSSDKEILRLSLGQQPKTDWTYKKIFENNNIWLAYASHDDWST